MSADLLDDLLAGFVGKTSDATRAKPSDSQSFAAHSQDVDAPQSEHWRGFSQNSQDSQGPTAAAHSQTQKCRTCGKQSRYRTCLDPVGAGLSPVWLIQWPPADHAATCPAWTPKPMSANETTSD